MLPRLTQLVLLSFALACSGPAEEECNATRPCAAGFDCVRAAQTTAAGGTTTSRCVAQSTPGNGFTCPETGVTGPANLLDNPGFECDPLSQWNEGLFGKLTRTPGRTGSGGGRWTSSATATGQQTHYWLHSYNEATVTGGQRACASAWVRGTGTNAVVKIDLVGPTVIRQSFAQLLTANWTRIENSTLVGPSDTRAIFGVGLRQASAGDYIEVDDAAMWISTQPDGGCSNR